MAAAVLTPPSLVRPCAPSARRTCARSSLGADKGPRFVHGAVAARRAGGRTRAADDEAAGAADAAGPEAKRAEDDLARDVSKSARQIAATFAPRASTAKKNPAVPGSALHDIFVYQSYVSLAVGGLLAFNVIFPSDEPDIARLMGMWSPWMLAVPSLRARDSISYPTCGKKN